jgi:SAM-dependent methyltransferase
MPSFDRPHDPHVPPSPWVARFAHLVKPAGTVLDVAAGHGRHTRFFADRGHKVTAVDIDVSDLADLQGDGRVEIREQDLEGEPWPFAPQSFDAIIVANYLHRPHFPHLASSLTVGGILIYETFGQGNEAYGRPRNPDFLLAPGELLSAFQGTLQIIAYEHGVEETPRPAVRQRICAVNATAPQSLTFQAP